MKIRSLDNLKNIFKIDSWTDLFIRWLYHLPMPYWITCIVISCAMLYINYFIFFGLKNYTYPWPNISIDFPLGIIISYGLYVLWQLQNDIKKSLLNTSIFQEDNAITSKPKPAWANALFLIIKNLLRIAFLSVAAILIIYQFYIFIWFTALAILTNIGIRILNIVISIYNLKWQNIKINVWALSPLYQLSQATLRLVLYLSPLTIVWFCYSLSMSLFLLHALNKDVAQIFSSGIQPFGYFTEVYYFILIIGLALITIQTSIFILPVMWVRKKIIGAKAESLREINVKLLKIFEDEDRFAKDENFIKVKDLRAYIDALMFRKEQIKKASEWPWDINAVREFSTAIFVPIILWIAQLYLSRWLDK